MAKYWRHTAQPKLGQGMRAAQPRLLNLIRNQVEHALSAQVRNKRAARERAARVAPRVLRPPRRLERRSTLVAAALSQPAAQCLTSAAHICPPFRHPEA